MEGEANNLTPAILVGAFTLLGVIVSVVVERFFRTIGKITCEPQEGWEPKLSFENPEGSSDYLAPIVPSRAPFYPGQEPDSASYAFTLEFFNSKELPVGLRSIKIVFKCADGDVSRIPDDPETHWEGAGISRYDPVSNINLPPRQLVSRRFRGSIGGKDAQTLSGWKTARFVAEYPGRGWFSKGTYSEIIAER